MTGMVKKGMLPGEIAQELNRPLNAIYWRLKDVPDYVALRADRHGWPEVGPRSEQTGLAIIMAHGGFEAFSERLNVHGEHVIALPLIWPARAR